VSALAFIAPALPLHAAGKYVAGAYIVFLVIILVYVSIMALRLKRNERELNELARELRARRAARDPSEHETEEEAAPNGRAGVRSLP
jgi:flagellar biosynthesis/type III secretory pathway M-ring protein FliF/YscJ